jgi:hypothetical protein
MTPAVWGGSQRPHTPRALPGPQTSRVKAKLPLATGQMRTQLLPERADQHTGRRSLCPAGGRRGREHRSSLTIG